MEISPNIALALGTAIASFAVAWGVARSQIKTLMDEIKELKGKLSTSNELQYSRLNNLEARAMSSEGKLDGIASIMSPEKIGEHMRQQATFQTETKLRLEFLENGCTKCRGA